MKFIETLDNQLSAAFSKAFTRKELTEMKNLIEVYRDQIVELLVEDEDEAEALNLDLGGDEE